MKGNFSALAVKRIRKNQKTLHPIIRALFINKLICIFLNLGFPICVLVLFPTKHLLLFY
jgi:hypothetical protein